MKIGLYNIEPKIQNTALMQISYHHKKQGDDVEWYQPPSLFHKYHKIYCSSLFDFTDKSDVPTGAICGGTGFDLATTLPFDCDLDYSLYPACDCSYLWFSRGCIRNCGFCIVRRKEGKIRVTPPTNLNPRGTYIKIQDNNFFASPAWREAIQYLKGTKQPVDFAGGIDVRVMDEEKCKALNSLKHEKQIKIAWDNPKSDLRAKLKNLTKYIKGYRLRCYVLIGYDSTQKEDIKRVDRLKELGIDIYIMCIDRTDPDQKKFQKWVQSFKYRDTAFKDFDYAKFLQDKKIKTL